MRGREGRGGEKGEGKGEERMDRREGKWTPQFLPGSSPMPAFAFPAAAGTHLPTPEGWLAE